MKTKALIVSLLCLCSCLCASETDRISVDGTTFVRNGSRIYLNGVNTPWDHWNDFGGASGWNDYDSQWWDTEFKKLADAGINSCRVWITCDGANDGFIYANGQIEGMTDAFWRDCDDLLRLARKHRIYLMATMMSFDHTESGRAHFDIWRSTLSDPDVKQAFIDNFLLPFVQRYRDDPWLYAVDLRNEIEWIHESSHLGALSWEHLQDFVARSAAAIHDSGSPVLVTMGTASVKWNSASFEGNYWSDTALQGRYDSPSAYLDFYQLHYYDWMHPWFGAPIHDRSPESFGLTDRPVVVGEMPIHPSQFGGAGTALSVLEAFEFMHRSGYAGHYPWMPNASPDSQNGVFADMEVAARSFAETYLVGLRTVVLRVMPGGLWHESNSSAVPVEINGHQTFSELDSGQDTSFEVIAAGDG
jgi:hypothetical protein